VYFECGSMCCCEAFRSQAETDIQFAPTFKWVGRGCLFPPSGVGRMPWDIVDRIVEYTERSLSFESDIINGILGIFRVFGDMEYAIKHYWGVLILTPIADPNGLGIESQRPLTEGFIMGLCSFTHQLSERRTGFPSWSWTGWLGKAKNKNTDPACYTHSAARTSAKVKISVELSNKQVMPCETLLQLQLADNYNPSILTIFLHIEA
jgi:hypothetical protein